MNRLMTMLKTGAKLAVCGTIIAAIGFAFIVLTPDGTVGDADADLYWLSPGDFTSNQQKFVDMLEDEGFSEPKAYEWNDNIVYFSHGETSESPREVSERIQRALVREGLNNEVYPIPPDPNSIENVMEGSQIDREQKKDVAYSTLAARDFVSGGLVPTVDTGDYIALSGIDTPVEDGRLQDMYDLNDLTAFMALMNSYSGNDMADLIDNVRYIEAFRPKGSSQTQKVAMFGDGDLEMRNFAPGAGSASSGDGAVPACPGCERNTDFKGTEGEHQYQMQTYNSPDTPDGVVNFYQRAMAQRGWQLSTANEMVQQLRSEKASVHADDNFGEMLTFVRGSDMVQVHVYRGNNGQTMVNIFRGD